MTLNLFYINIYSLWTEVFLLIIICFCLIFGSIFSSSLTYKFPVLFRSVMFFTLQGFLLSLILLLNTSPVFLISWNAFIICDSFAFYSKIIILFTSIFWILIFTNNNNKILNFEFWILSLLGILSIFLVLQSYDLLSIYLNIEFISLVFYILASLNRNSEFSTESGLKYFILGALSSAILLFGFSMIYSLTGLTNLQDLTLFFTEFNTINLSLNIKNGILLSLLCILTSFLFKLGSAPFHYWLPDVYEGAPLAVTAFFALIPKLAIFSLLIRFVLITFLDFSHYEIYLFLIICTFLSSLIGTFGTFNQLKWKRFIAFSSINHLGFFLLNLCTVSLNNLNNLIIYLIIYLIMTASFFSFFSTLNFFSFPNTYNRRFLKSLNFFSILNPILSFSFLILLFSLAGIPPLAGFFSKFFVLFSAISCKFFGIVFFLLILNCISCFYYISLIKQMYFNNFTYNILPVYTIPSRWNLTALGILISVLLLSFINFDFFFLLGNLMCISFIN